MAFSKAQTMAIRHGGGPCLVLAGPGSGKTLTIVNRIIYLIKKRNIPPEEILVITFTKYAAVQMKERFFNLAKGERPPVTVGTFHGIYYGILKWAYRLGPENIFSEEEKLKLIRQIVKEQKPAMPEEDDFLADTAAEIGLVKNKMLDIERYKSKKYDEAAFRNIFREYELRRKKLRKIDFEDMLVMCYELFMKRPDILKLWQQKFKYVLIDEFQDINKIQYDVIKLLAAPENNIFAVGDDDQSIYGFRGADSRLMFQFKKDFPNAKEILLDINFRSAANIVTHALKVIENNKVRFKKDIRPIREKGAAVHVQETLNPASEAEYVLEDIKRRSDAGVSFCDIAVLFRVYTDAVALTERLAERGIAFQMREYIPNIYEHFIARDIQTYFRITQGSTSRQDFLNIINRPARYISREAFSDKEVSFGGLRRFYRDKKWMLDRIDDLEWDIHAMSKLSPAAAIKYLRRNVGYDDFIRKYALEKKIPADGLFEILNTLEEAAQPYGTKEEWFLHIENYTNALKKVYQSKENERTGIRLMTIHSAKGLEFDTVYIIEANEGQMPYKKSLKEQGPEEERRLFYVAMTRAKNVLKISYVKIKNGKETCPSRFVDELFDV